jgi:hypothetical protein
MTDSNPTWITLLFLSLMLCSGAGNADTLDKFIQHYNAQEFEQAALLYDQSPDISEQEYLYALKVTQTDLANTFQKTSVITLGQEVDPAEIDYSEGFGISVSSMEYINSNTEEKKFYQIKSELEGDKWLSVHYKSFSRKPLVLYFMFAE